MKAHNLIGQKFGRLTVVSRAENDKHGKTMWNCICDCGNTKEKPTGSRELLSGNTKSCGCLKVQKLNESKASSTHGMSRSALYTIWRNMKSRCYNKSNCSYKDYGERGIVVCDEWKHSFSIFAEWAKRNGYSKGLSIDRINVNGNYEPSNCRFSTSKVQANNRRNNVIISLNGKNHTVSEWSEITGLSSYMIYQRLKKGWSGKDAITIPSTPRSERNKRRK